MRSLHLPAFLSRQSAPGNAARAAQPSRQQMEAPPLTQHDAAISSPISANIRGSPQPSPSTISTTTTTNSSLGGALAPLVHSQSLPASQLRIPSPPPVFIRTTSGATISLVTATGSFTSTGGGPNSSSLVLLPAHVPPGSCPYKQDDVEPNSLPTVQPLFVSNDPILADDEIDALIASVEGVPSLPGSPVAQRAAAIAADVSLASSPITGLLTPEASQGGAAGVCQVTPRDSGTESSYDGMVIATGNSQENMAESACYDGLLSVSPRKGSGPMQHAPFSTGKGGPGLQQGSPRAMGDDLLGTEAGCAVKAMIHCTDDAPGPSSSPLWQRTDTTTTTSSSNNDSTGGGGSESDACDRRPRCQNERVAQLLAEGQGECNQPAQQQQDGHSCSGHTASGSRQPAVAGKQAAMSQAELRHSDSQGVAAQPQADQQQQQQQHNAKHSTLSKKGSLKRGTSSLGLSQMLQASTTLPPPAPASAVLPSALQGESGSGGSSVHGGTMVGGSRYNLGVCTSMPGLPWSQRNSFDSGSAALPVLPPPVIIETTPGVPLSTQPLLVIAHHHSYAGFDATGAALVAGGASGSRTFLLGAPSLNSNSISGLASSSASNTVHPTASSSYAASAANSPKQPTAGGPPSRMVTPSGLSLLGSPRPSPSAAVSPRGRSNGQVPIHLQTPFAAASGSPPGTRSSGGGAGGSSGLASTHSQSSGARSTNSFAAGASAAVAAAQLSQHSTGGGGGNSVSGGEGLVASRRARSGPFSSSASGPQPLSVSYTPQCSKATPVYLGALNITPAWPLAITPAPVITAAAPAPGPASVPAVLPAQAVPGATASGGWGAAAAGAGASGSGCIDRRATAPGGGASLSTAGSLLSGLVGVPPVSPGRTSLDYPGGGPSPGFGSCVRGSPRGYISYSGVGSGPPLLTRLGTAPSQSRSQPLGRGSNSGTSATVAGGAYPPRASARPSMSGKAGAGSAASSAAAAAAMTGAPAAAGSAGKAAGGSLQQQ